MVTNMIYNVYELFGDAGCEIDAETGEIICYSWDEAVLQCMDLQQGRILDFEGGRIYKPTADMPEPKESEF